MPTRYGSAHGIEVDRCDRIVVLGSGARCASTDNVAPDFPVTVNFDQGLPDPRYFPVDAIKRHIIATLEQDGVDALRYFGAGGASEMQYGYVGLREQLAQWMAASRRPQRGC